MHPTFFLSIALLIGQSEVPAADNSSSETPAPAVSSVDSAAPTSLMTILQGTGAGNFLDEKKILISGWTEASFTGSSASREQLPFGFNYRANEFLLQQNWLRIEHAVDPSAKSTTYGFRLDTILPGSDYRFTIARGLFDDQLTSKDGSPATYGIDPVQFYSETYVPGIGQGLDIKLGRFFSPYGAESIDTTQTPLASRAYTFIYNPFTNTGLLTSLKVSDSVSIQNGLVTGNDVFIDKASNLTYIGGFQWKPADGKESLQFTTLLGCGRYDVEQNFNNPQVFDLLYTRQLTEKTGYTCDALFGFQNDVPGIGTANWFGVVQYLSYKLSPRLSATTRLEFFDDVQGNRTGYKGLYTAVTGGFDFRPRPNIILRPELRYDHNDSSQPFEGDSSLLTATFDLIVKW